MLTGFTDTSDRNQSRCALRTDDLRMTRSESRLTLRSPATSAPALDAPPRPEAFPAHRALTEVADWVVGALGETAGLAAAAARERSGARGFRTAQKLSTASRTAALMAD